VAIEVKYRTPVFRPKPEGNTTAFSIIRANTGTAFNIALDEPRPICQEVPFNRTIGNSLFSGFIGELGPVNTNWIDVVESKNSPIKARGV